MVWLLVALLCWPAFSEAAVGSSAVDTWYVRPTAACANNGDGLAYECAASPGASGAFRDPANIIWTATVGVDDGDTLYVCGSHVDTTFPVGVVAGTSALPIKISFSCPSDRGSIRAVHAMSEALTAGNWTNESANLWYLSLAGYTSRNPMRLWINSVEQFPADAKVNIGTNINGGTPLSVWFYDSATSRVYLQSTANPATGMTSMESLVALSGTCADVAMCLDSASIAYVEIINPILEGGNSVSLSLKGPSYIAIYGTASDDSLCQIGKNGRRGIWMTDTNGAGSGTVSSDLSVRDCTIDQTIPSQFEGYRWEWNVGSGDGVHMYAGTTRVTIDSNTITDWLHAGFYPVAVAGTTSVTDIRVMNNTISCRNQVSYCRAFGVDGAAVGRATRIEILGNTISNTSIRSQFNGNGNVLSGNIFSGQRQDIVYSNRSESLESQGYAGPSQDNIVSNNMFINNTTAPCISLRSDANTISGNQYLNNLLVNCGGSYESGFENVSLSVRTGAGVGNNTFRGNLIYDSAQTNTVYYKGTGKTTVAGFQSACSGDVCSGNLSTEPTFPSATDFRPSSTSPVRRAGVNGPCADVRGRVCPSDRPHIGAYQSTSGDPAATRAVRN